MAKSRTTMTIEFDGGMKEINKIIKLLNGKTHDMSFTIKEIEKKPSEFDDFPDLLRDGTVIYNKDGAICVIREIEDGADGISGKNDNMNSEEGGWNEL